MRSDEPAPLDQRPSIYSSRGRRLGWAELQGPFTVETKQIETVDNDTALVTLLLRPT